jgi:hypothetical protein
MNRAIEIAALLLATAIVLACDPQGTVARRAQSATAPTCTDFGAEYAGFAGTKLHDGRAKANIGVDRARVKPYSALRVEYARVLGAAPAGLEGAKTAFPTSPSPRFSVEPRANAIQVHAAYRLAFEGCLPYVARVPELEEEPTTDRARTTCQSMARQFWSRAPTSAEVEACSSVALEASAAESSPQRRWAHTCAALLTSAGFLTY